MSASDHHLERGPEAAEVLLAVFLRDALVAENAARLAEAHLAAKMDQPAEPDLDAGGQHETAGALGDVFVDDSE